jgi:hypothetical protein
MMMTASVAVSTCKSSLKQEACQLGNVVPWHTSPQRSVLGESGISIVPQVYGF